MLKGKNAVITGARRGIGRETVEVFAQYGANVWACARKPDMGFESDMRELSERFSVNIEPVYFDIANEEEMKNAIQMIRKSKKNVDVLVNTAGIAAQSTSFSMMSEEKINHVFEVNFFGITRLTQYISRMMIRQKSGCIINVSSIAGIDGEPAQYEYAASKAALIGATRHLASELSAFNIRVNAVAPGIIDTQMGAQIGDDLKHEILSKVMMKRIGKPREVANVIAFLSSDLSSYMTGQTIRIDGGM